MRNIILEFRKLIFVKLLSFAFDVLPKESPFYSTYAKFLRNNLDKEL